MLALAPALLHFLFTSSSSLSSSSSFYCLLVANYLALLYIAHLLIILITSPFWIYSPSFAYLISLYLKGNNSESLCASAINTAMSTRINFLLLVRANLPTAKKQWQAFNTKSDTGLNHIAKICYVDTQFLDIFTPCYRDCSLNRSLGCECCKINSSITPNMYHQVGDSPTWESRWITTTYKSLFGSRTENPRKRPGLW